MNKCISIVFVAICAALFLMNFGPEKGFSETENRVLSQAPAFSWKALFQDKYTEKFETYIQDQFYARDFWVKLKNEGELLLQKKDSGGTYFGADGGYLEKKDAPAAGQFEKNIAQLSGFYDLAKEKNIQTAFLAIPSAGTVYPKRVPTFAAYTDEVALLQALEQNLPFPVADPLPLLQAHEDENLYFRTDHHWTQRGAYYAYVALGETLGYTPVPLEDFTRETIPDFYGSLYSKAPYFGVEGDTVEYFVGALTPKIEYLDHKKTDKTFYTEANFKKKDKYTIFMNGNNSELIVRMGTDTGRTLLVAKDSFSHPLIPFLAAHFDNIHVVDLRYFPKPFSAYCADNGVTDVLFSYNVSWFADDANLGKVLK